MKIFLAGNVWALTLSIVSFILAILSWYVGIIMTCLILEKFDKICARASQSILSASFIFLPEINEHAA